MNNEQNQQSNQLNEPQAKPFDPNNPPEGWVAPNYAQTEMEQAREQANGKAKPWYKSKTLWFNGIVSVLGFATTATPVFEPYMTPDTFGLLTAGVAFGNAVLRFMTHKPVKGGVGTNE